MPENTFPTVVITSLSELQLRVEAERVTAKSIDITPCLINCERSDGPILLRVNEIDGAGIGAAIAVRHRDSFLAIVIPAVTAESIPALAERLGIPMY